MVTFTICFVIDLSAFVLVSLYGGAHNKDTSPLTLCPLPPGERGRDDLPSFEGRVLEYVSLLIAVLITVAILTHWEKERNSADGF
jgi:hypothetical protein